MSDTYTLAGAPPAPKGLGARFVGIIVSPKATFQSVVAHPRWFGMLALVTITMAVLVGGFLITETGRNAWLEQLPASMSEQQYESMVRFSAYIGYAALAQMLIAIPLITVVTAGILFAVFNTMGGDATFRQVMAVVTHASAVSILGQLFTVPLNYLRGSTASATNLAVLMPMVDSESFAGRLLATIDLFIIWYVMVLAIGLAVLYRRRTQPIAVTLYGVYAVIAVVIAAVMSRLGGA